tara:strand:+ start:1268 stop:1444 length:177 start_codon:yes stop_codon:yes gene_type:complete
MIKSISSWIVSRFAEPSSYAAIGLVVMGVGIVIDQPIMVFVGIAGGALGFILKERGII